MNTGNVIYAKWSLDLMSKQKTLMLKLTSRHMFALIVRICLLIIFINFAPPVTAQTEPPKDESKICYERSEAIEIDRRLAERDALKDSVRVLEAARKQDAEVVESLKEILTLSRRETAELRAAVTELVKNAPKKSRCVIFCVNF